MHITNYNDIITNYNKSIDNNIRFIIQYDLLSKYLPKYQMLKNETRVNFNKYCLIASRTLTSTYLFILSLVILYLLLNMVSIIIENKQYLYSIYKKHNAKLYKILGYPIKEWEDYYKKNLII